jgi:hypothetical protein
MHRKELIGENVSSSGRLPSAKHGRSALGNGNLARWNYHEPADTLETNTSGK